MKCVARSRRLIESVVEPLHAHVRRVVQRRARVLNGSLSQESLTLDSVADDATSSVAVRLCPLATRCTNRSH